MQSLDEWIVHLYPDLKRRAGALFRHESSRVTLQPTALVHEAYVRLHGQNTGEWTDRPAFLAAACATMRRVLVDYARERRADKRGGGVVKVCLEDAAEIAGAGDLDVLDLDRILNALRERNGLAERVVDLRVFGGFSFSEIAEILDVSEASVYRAWRYARAFVRGAKDAVAEVSGGD